MKKIEFELQGNGYPRFYELLREIGELHDRKNSDYARKDDALSNFRECERFGVAAWKGCLVRLSDKWSRIVRLAEKADTGEVVQVDESLVDTLMDLANYSLLTIILYELRGGE